MPRERQPAEVIHGCDIVSLRLPRPERDVITTSPHVADSRLVERVRETKARSSVTFDLEELEDLHRGLALDADETLDTKRRKTITKILGKIEEILDDESLLAEADFEGAESWRDAWVEAPPPNSLVELLENLFGGARSESDAQLPPCRVRLTAAQREILRGMDTVSLDIQKMLAVESEDKQEFEFNPRQLLTASLAVIEALDAAADAESAQPYAELGRQLSESLFDTMEEAAELDEHERYRRTQGDPQSYAYQLKITLDGSKPPIWRRVEVADCTLDVLHNIIQTAMGWTNSHLHMFEFDGDHFSNPKFELDPDDYDETQVWLSELIADGCQKLRYSYDFGDNWWHTINIEQTLNRKPADRFPKCVKGVGGCPPEDCGGIWGYYELLQALRDPSHKRHDELLEWVGEDFKPGGFDIEEVNEALAAGRLIPFDS